MQAVKQRIANLFIVKINGLQEQLTTQFFQGFSFIIQRSDIYSTPNVIKNTPRSRISKPQHHVDVELAFR